jgi:hypothetical protein
VAICNFGKITEIEKRLKSKYDESPKKKKRSKSYDDEDESDEEEKK